MIAESTSWESRLLSMALGDEAPSGGSRVHPDLFGQRQAAGDKQLNQAYLHCDAVAREHSRTFYMASSLLPPAKRRAVRALYAFCRVTDDLIDQAQGDLAAGLLAWEDCVLSLESTCNDLIALAWADTRARYGIPARYGRQLIEGVATDLVKKRYASFNELAVYCYGVASTVGLMSTHIVGYSGPDAVPYAIKLGVAMQLTNILRDVREDWDAGRVYLPQDELAAFGLGDDDIAAGRNTDRWRHFMRYQIDRNYRLYEEAVPGIALLDPSGRFAIAAAADLYRAILGKIEANAGDVFSRRVHLTMPAKLRRLPGIWWRTGARSSRRAAPGSISPNRPSPLYP